jgi:hypothetical protein
VSATDVFLSYARQDRGVARMFAEALGDEGFNVWWDASLHSGETFDEVIEQHLREAKAVVVLWSPRSVASRWVRAEATQADRRNKLVPAMIEQCDRPVIFELTHTADLCDWTGDVTDIHWRSFMDDLRRKIEGRSEGEVPAASRPAARPKPVASGPANRQPLRPGSDEVILAAGAGPQILNPRRQPEADAAGELHCLEAEEELGQEPIVIASSGLKLGRSRPADIVLPHKSISREHCIVGLANDELLVTDLNSTNGTYIDDVRITRATILPPGSVLRVGQLSLRHTIRTSSDGAVSRVSAQGPRLAAAS